MGRQFRYGGTFGHRVAYNVGWQSTVGADRRAKGWVRLTLMRRRIVFYMAGNGSVLVKLLQLSLATPFVHSREYTPAPSFVQLPNGVPG